MKLSILAIGLVVLLFLSGCSSEHPPISNSPNSSQVSASLAEPTSTPTPSPTPFITASPVPTLTPIPEQTEEPILSTVETPSPEEELESTPEPEATPPSLLSELQSDDFSSFSGVYRPYEMFRNGYGDLDDIILYDNGEISGGLPYGLSYAGTAPLSVEETGAGSFECVVTRGERIGQGNNYRGEFYVLIPSGVSSGFGDYFPYENLETDSVRLRYVSIDGGVTDILYYRLEQ